MKTAHQNTPTPQQNQDVANKAFVVDLVASGSAVVFDDSVPSVDSNIRSARILNQSAIDNTKTQITNLGSKDGLTNPAALGATGKGATIGGGNDNQASGPFYPTVGGGVGNTASDSYATVGGGQQNLASNVSTTIGGGAGNVASGNSSTIPGGQQNLAEGDNSTAIGHSAKTTRDGQLAYSAGVFANPGDAQTSFVIMRGETPGLGGEEVVELMFGASGSQMLTLEDGKAYVVVMDAVARGLRSGSPSVQAFRQTFVARRAAGVTTLSASGVMEQLGDASSSGWSINVNVQAAPDRLRFRFGIGLATSNARCVAKVAFTEVTAP